MASAVGSIYRRFSRSISRLAGYTERKTCLLIIDVQYDFCEGGRLEVADGSKTIPVINKLREKVPFDSVVLSQDWHPAGHISFHSTNVKSKPGIKLFDLVTLDDGTPQVMWPDHCIQGSDGAKFHHDLVMEPTDKIVQKGLNPNIDSYSSFWDNMRKNVTTCCGILKQDGITDVYVVGLAFDFCVSYSALDSNELGFNTYVVVDACRGVAHDSSVKQLEKLQNSGVQIVTSEQVISAGYTAPLPPSRTFTIKDFPYLAPK